MAVVDIEPAQYGKPKDSFQQIIWLFFSFSFSLSLSTPSLSFLLQTAASKPLHWLSTKVNTKEKPTQTAGRPTPAGRLTRSYSELCLPAARPPIVLHPPGFQTDTSSNRISSGLSAANHSISLESCGCFKSQLLRQGAQLPPDICTANASASTLLSLSPKYNWWTGAIAVRAGWRCSTTARGERCATTTGTWWMPTWCVSSWTAVWLWRWAAAPTLDKARASSFWITWTAKGTRASWPSATALAGTCTTATTMRMWGSPAKVNCLLSPSR